MPKATKTTTTPRRAPLAPPQMPPVLPPSAEEQAADRETLARLEQLIVVAKQRNLDNAIKLAQLAAAHRLPQELEEHFGELGRRYAELTYADATLKAPPLRVIEGGAA